MASALIAGHPVEEWERWMDTTAQDHPASWLRGITVEPVEGREGLFVRIAWEDLTWDPWLGINPDLTRRSVAQVREARMTYREAVEG